MEYNIEMEEVLELWQNVSKDVEYISKDMGMSVVKVHEILEELSKRGDIIDYEERILRFNEVYIDPDSRRKMGLDSVHGQTNLYGVYNGQHYTIHTLLMIKKHNCVSVYLVVHAHLLKDVEIRMDYESDENVYYRPAGLEKNDYADLQSLQGYILATNTKKEFDDMTEKILNDILPSDYFDKSKNKVLN
jgi:hypothetical protein